MLTAFICLLQSFFFFCFFFTLPISISKVPLSEMKQFIFCVVNQFHCLMWLSVHYGVCNQSYRTVSWRIAMKPWPPQYYQCVSWIKNDSWLFVHACVHEDRSGVFFKCLCGGYSLAVSQGVEDKVERDAVPALLKQQATAAPATDNSTHHAVEHVITYPSRLIYYLNEDSESTYHDLDTRAKNQATEGKVSQHRRGMGEGDWYWDAVRSYFLLCGRGFAVLSPYCAFLNSIFNLILLHIVRPKQR